MQTAGVQPTPQVQGKTYIPRSEVLNKKGKPRYRNLKKGKWADAEPEHLRAVAVHAEYEWEEVLHDRKMLRGIVVTFIAVLGAFGLTKPDRLLAEIVMNTNGDTTPGIDHLGLALVVALGVLVGVSFCWTVIRIFLAQQRRRLAATWLAANGVSREAPTATAGAQVGNG